MHLHASLYVYTLHICFLATQWTLMSYGKQCRSPLVIVCHYLWLLPRPCHTRVTILLLMFLNPLVQPSSNHSHSFVISATILNPNSRLPTTFFPHFTSCLRHFIQFHYSWSWFPLKAYISNSMHIQASILSFRVMLKYIKILQ